MDSITAAYLANKVAPVLAEVEAEGEIVSLTLHINGNHGGVDMIATISDNLGIREVLREVRR